MSHVHIRVKEGTQYRWVYLDGALVLEGVILHEGELLTALGFTFSEEAVPANFFDPAPTDGGAHV